MVIVSMLFGLESKTHPCSLLMQSKGKLYDNWVRDVRERSEIEAFQ